MSSASPQPLGLETSDPAYVAEGLAFVTVRSPALRQRADLTLWLPPQAAAGARNLPIVTLLHGAYGSHWAWALKGGAHRTAARLIAGGVLPPVVLAMPSDGLWGEGSGYVPHAGQDFERWVAFEVPAVVRQVCDACSEVSPLFVAGLSMGGFGALHLAARHPRRYAAAAGHSSVTDLAHMDRLLSPPGRAGWSAAAHDQRLIDAFTAATAPLPPLRFDCGRDDDLLPANRALHRELETAGIAHDYAEHEGGHDWAYWTRHLEDSLRFFAGVPAAAPG